MRNLTLDLAKFICAILVVTIHLWSREGLLYYIPNGIARVAVPFFFVASGYFIKGKIQNGGNLFTYVTKYFIIYIFWSLVFFVFAYLENSDSLIINLSFIAHYSLVFS